MGAYLYTNVASLSAQRNLASSQDRLSTSVERLSSGKRVNSARDDAAGAAIAKRFEGNVRGIRQGVRNAADGEAMAVAGEAALEQMAQMTLRIRELAVQAQNGTYNTGETEGAPNDYENINAEIQALKTGIEQLATNAEYNGMKLLDGNFSQNIKYSDIGDAEAAVVAVGTAEAFASLDEEFADVENQATAAAARVDADALLGRIATARSDFSKAAVRLGYVGEAQASLADAIDSARSRIEDTDYAAETAAMTRNQILQQAATAALAQANAMPNTILSLIK